MERTAGYVLVSPLDDQHVVAALLDQVADAVLVSADVAYTHLLARQLRSHHAHHQHVDACTSHTAAVCWHSVSYCVQERCDIIILHPGTRAMLITKTKTRTKMIAIRLLKLKLELKYLKKTKTI